MNKGVQEEEKALQAFFLNFTLMVVRTLSTSTNWRGTKTLKFTVGDCISWIILILFPLQGGVTLNVLEKCLFPFMVLYVVLNYNKYKFFAFRCVI